MTWRTQPRIQINPVSDIEVAEIMRDEFHLNRMERMQQARAAYALHKARPLTPAHQQPSVEAIQRHELPLCGGGQGRASRDLPAAPIHLGRLFENFLWCVGGAAIVVLIIWWMSK